MNSELSQNVAASLEGWYSDHWSWRWIDWQYCAVLPLMFACIWYGVPREKINTACCATSTGPGSSMPWSASPCSTPALDQGNRLDWTNNGLVIGLLLAGGLLTLRLRRAGADRRHSPFLNLRLLLRGNLLVLCCCWPASASSSSRPPTSSRPTCRRVQNFRELQVGAVLLWIALPQLAIVLPLGCLLRRVDARWVLAFGAVLIGDRLPDGDRADQRMGDRRFPAVAGPAGDRPILRADRAGGAGRPHRSTPPMR